MATSYPGGLDAFSPAISGDNQSDTVGGRTHEAMHNDINDGVVAIQTELGADPAGASTTVVARLNAADAATIQKAGRYETFSSANTATAINGVTTVTGTTTITLPTAASISGQTFTIRNTGTAVVTIARTSSQTIDGTAANVTLLKGSITVASDGANWVVLNGSYADETIGRRLFSWDNNSGRWQTTYSDTGWRDISASLENSWTAGAAMMRRAGHQITFQFLALNGASAGTGVLYTPPTGFRTNTAVVTQDLFINGVTTGTLFLCLSAPALTVTGTYASVTNGRLRVQHTSNDAWPASLPGTASTSIPV